MAIHKSVNYCVKQFKHDQDNGEEDIGVLNANEFFGERALLSAEPRQANIIATEALECLVLERDSFKKWLANVDDVRQKKAARDAKRVAARPKATPPATQSARLKAPGVVERLAPVRARAEMALAMDARPLCCWPKRVVECSPLIET